MRHRPGFCMGREEILLTSRLGEPRPSPLVSLKTWEAHATQERNGSRTMVGLVPRQATDPGPNGATKPARKPGSGCDDHANDDVKCCRILGSMETISFRRVYLSGHPGRRDTAQGELYVPTEDKAKREEEGS